jgi:hypothetical protein
VEGYEPGIAEIGWLLGQLERHFDEHDRCEDHNGDRCHRHDARRAGGWTETVAIGRIDLPATTTRVCGLALLPELAPSTAAGRQGNEVGGDCMVARSLFDLVVPEGRLSRRFRDFRRQEVFTAGRQVMDEIFADFPDVDHNFAKEFQTGGFSPRVLELALFAYLQEQGYDLDRASPAPDFVLSGSSPVAIEATTTNPPEGQDPDDVDQTTGLRRLVPADEPEAEQAFIFQVAKALRAKLTKRNAAGLAYWEQPHVAGLPFVIALESFFSASSLAYSIRPLGDYLYGRRDIPAFDEAGNLRLTSEPIAEHQYGGKTIPSGLFSQPEARHLSAVLFTNNATISKFNRIGTERGYGPPDVAMIRWGAIIDPHPNAIEPQMFGYLVGDYGPDERETFSEGLQVFHNPWADNPLDLGVLRDVTEHELVDGLVRTTTSRLEIISSITHIFQGVRAEQEAREALAIILGTNADAG